MTRCSAPGKMILFGEHAVVFGKPALALALDLRISVNMAESNEYLVNRRPMKRQHHAYISAAIDQSWDGRPVEITTRSGIPSGSGLGSSAAIAVASVGALLAHRNRFDPESVARKAFEVELAVQGRASPTDTSTSCNGHGVLVAQEELDGLLWRIDKGKRRWFVHHVQPPELTFVVGHTGIHASTGPLVERVKKLVETARAASDAVDRIAEIVMEGAERMGRGDKKGVGRLMLENHRLLNSLGVGHPLLEKAVDACVGNSYGAKLTGAGGGGSMIALTDDPDATCKAIESTGCVPIVVKVGCDGVRVEPHGSRAP